MSLTKLWHSFRKNEKWQFNYICPLAFSIKLQLWHQMNLNLDVEFKFFYLKSFSWMNYIESIEQLLTVKAFNWRICNILHQKTFPNAILLQTLFLSERYSFLNAIPYQTLFLSKRYSSPNAIPLLNLYLLLESVIYNGFLLSKKLLSI